MAIGLFGAHRTGKTTLARAYAGKHGIRFIETSVSAIFRDLGLDPARPMSFGRRLSVQREILDRLDALYERDAGQSVIYDRCPLDLLGYTLAEAVGNAVKERDQAAFERYVQDCFEVLNRRFSLLLLVQPGIALAPEAGKAALNPAYIEHLNSLMLGLSADPRNSVPRFYVPRTVLTIEERLRSLEDAVARSKTAIEATAGAVLLH